MTKRYRKERPPKMLRFFFWEGKLHRTLLIDRPRNILHAWSYPEGKRVQFVYSHIRVHKERAWKTAEVAKLVNRHPNTLHTLIAAGYIEKPAKTYSLKNDPAYLGVLFWTSKQVYDLHDFLLEETPGRVDRARAKTPSRMELVARMEEGISYVIEDEEGNRTRVFKETLW